MKEFMLISIALDMLFLLAIFILLTTISKPNDKQAKNEEGHTDIVHDLQFKEGKPATHQDT